MTDNAVIGFSTSRIIIIMESFILLEATNLPVDIIKTLMSTLTLYKTDRNGCTQCVISQKFSKALDIGIPFYWIISNNDSTYLTQSSSSSLSAWPTAGQRLTLLPQTISLFSWYTLFYTLLSKKSTKKTEKVKYIPDLLSHATVLRPR